MCLIIRLLENRFPSIKDICPINHTTDIHEKISTHSTDFWNGISIFHLQLFEEAYSFFLFKFRLQEKFIKLLWLLCLISLPFQCWLDHIAHDIESFYDSGSVILQNSPCSSFDDNYIMMIFRLNIVHFWEMP